ncbi:MAG: hypothetical protein J0L97_09765, partial [Alphaproteobacteria bacterium]|nr:hypothetical protein [Alphaproteobacteria bacterium]
MEPEIASIQPSFLQRFRKALTYFMLGLLIGVGFIAGGAYWQRDAIRERAKAFLGVSTATVATAEGEATPQEDGRYATLEQQLQQMRQQLDALSSQSAAPATGEGSPAQTLAEWEQLKPKLTDAMAKLQDMQSGQTAEAGALRKDVQSLKETLLTLQNDVNAIKASMPDLLKMSESLESQRSFSVLVSFIHLRDKAQAGKPYATELAGFRSVLEDPLEIKNPLAVLEQHAAAGVPTSASLAKVFPPLLRQAFGVDENAENEGIVSRTLDNLRKVVIVRHVGEEVENDTTPEGALARMERDVTNNDFAAAQAELAKLPAP